MSSDRFWAEDPNVFFDAPLDIIPNEKHTLNQKLNALSRLVVYGSVFLWSLEPNHSITSIVVGSIVLMVLFGIWKNYVPKVDTLFEIDMIASEEEDPFSRKPCRYPTSDNPFMNVTSYDYGSNSEFLPACRGPKIEKDAEQLFQAGAVQDPYDLFGKKSNNSRQWITLPSHVTTSNRDFFLKWRFKGAPTCKEDGKMCRPKWHAGQSWVET
jgi:hypothetical protein